MNAQPITVHYQPIVSLTTGEVVGCEALLRVYDASGATQPPGAGIQDLEATEEAAADLTARVLACIDRDLVPVLRANPRLYVSINIPPIVLGTGRLGEAIRDLSLVEFLHQVVFELTERQALTEHGRAALRLARELGARVAVDDFGTGESGLAQLLGLEFDLLKIDRAHISPLLRNIGAERLLRGLVALAAAIRVPLVAEGIETPEQALFLRAAGVEFGQGWYWSKAVESRELEQLATKGFTVPSSAF